MFNLSDSEVLTHRGQTLSEIERFEDTRSDDEDEERGSSGALKRKHHILQNDFFCSFFHCNR